MRLLFFLTALLITFNVNAQVQRPITARDLWNMTRLSSVELSPDGRSAAFVATTYDIGTNKGNGDIRLLSIPDGKVTTFTTGKGTEGNPAWSPDGKWIAFTAKRDDDEQRQLYLIPIDGGEARRITEMPLGVSGIKWFPDGRRVAFVSSTLPRCGSNFDSLKAEITRRKDSKVTARTSEDRFYRYWDHYLTDGYIDRLYAVKVDDGKVTDLTPELDRLCDPSGGIDYDIAPDGGQIIFSALTEGPPYNSLHTDLYTIPSDGSGAMQNITASNPADDMAGRYTPDGRFIVYGRLNNPDQGYEVTHLVRRDRANGEEVEICRSFDRSPSGWVIGDHGRSVFFTADDRGSSAIFSVPLAGGAVTELLGTGSSGDLHVTGSTLVFLRQSLSAPSEIYSMNTDGSGLRKLTQANDTLLAKLDMGRVENVSVPAAAGDSIQMFVVYPPGFDASKSWPLLVLLHGGPHGDFGDSFHPRWNAQVFAAPGYVAVMPNFHGSTGFGEHFADRINGAHADLPFQDIMAATDYMARKPFIDSTRMAAAGGSYGGYMSAWIGGHTNRFACLINHAGVYNLMAQFGSDITDHRDISYGGTPWDGREAVLKWSPSQYAANYSTPTLVMHGEKDYRVPYGQGLELYGMLKAKNVPARLVLYPDENHWVLSAQNSINWYEEFDGWLKRWIGAGGR